MQREEFDDRRIFERIPTEFSLRLLGSYSNREGLAQAKDISAKGIGFETAEELPAYTPLEMWLKIPDKGEPLYTRGKVVWSRLVEPNRYRVGVNLEAVRFMEISRVLRAT